MKDFIPSTYQELFEVASHFNEIKKPDVGAILNHLGYKGISISAQAPVFYVLDYSQARYLFIDPSSYQVLGFKSNEFLEKGPKHVLSNWHPNDLKIFEQKIFPEAMEFLRHKRPEEYADFSFTCNYRFKAKYGSWLTLLQRSSYFIASEQGTPLAAVGFVVDISHFKEDSTMIHIIEKVDRTLFSLSKTLIKKSVYYPDGIGLLSEREVELLRLIYEGLTSKEIAGLLSLSVHTVNNHRKNMMIKTKSKNVGELIHYAQNLKAL